MSKEKQKFDTSDIYNMADYMFRVADNITTNSIKKIHYCKECGTELKISYLENTIYMVWCPWCETIFLVKESNPERAFNKIGIREEEIGKNKCFEESTKTQIIKMLKKDSERLSEEYMYMNGDMKISRCGGKVGYIADLIKRIREVEE